MKNIKINGIFAVSDNGVIGDKNGLPWRIKDDLKHFKEITQFKPVIMGRKTCDSIGKPLKDRYNIVLSRHTGFSQYGLDYTKTVKGAIKLVLDAGFTECYVIGGAEIFKLFYKYYSTLYATRVLMTVQGDTKLPFFDLLEKDFKIEVESNVLTEGEVSYKYQVLEKL